MKNIIEVIKTNKKAIVKKALIIGGTVIALAIVANQVQKGNGELEEDFDENNQDNDQTAEQEA